MLVELSIMEQRYHALMEVVSGAPVTEVARLRALGATDIDLGQGDVPWTVLADPEGNEFCVLTPR